MTYAYQWHGEDFDRSIKEAEASVEMSPYDAAAKGAIAYQLVNAGRVDEAIEWASWAIAHDARKTPFSRNNLAWAYYAAGRYEEALETFRPLGDCLTLHKARLTTRVSAASTKQKLKSLSS